MYTLISIISIIVTYCVEHKIKLKLSCADCCAKCGLYGEF